MYSVFTPHHASQNKNGQRHVTTLKSISLTSSCIWRAMGLGSLFTRHFHFTLHQHTHTHISKMHASLLLTFHFAAKSFAVWRPLKAANTTSGWEKYVQDDRRRLYRVEINRLFRDGRTTTEKKTTVRTLNRKCHFYLGRRRRSRCRRRRRTHQRIIESDRAIKMTPRIVGYIYIVFYISCIGTQENWFCGIFVDGLEF